MSNDLYNMIFKRRSVRTYMDDNLSEKELDTIKKFIHHVKQLDGTKATFRLITRKEMGVNLAPYYIVASSKKEDLSYVNIGYSLEQIDLYLQSIGLGSLWLGSKSPKIKNSDDCIVLAFGKTKVPYRFENEFNRLDVSKISKSNNEITRAARLSPSSINSQPWKIECRNNEIIIQLHSRGPMKLVLEKKLNKIDIGIVTCFVVLTLNHLSKELISIIPIIKKKKLIITIKYEK